MKYADLHVHTFYSDSTFSPEEVMRCADKRGLAAVAICDHDCVDGIDPCREYGARAGIGVEVIPGVELTAEQDDTEIHILGYFIDWRDAAFRKKLAEIQKTRVDRICRMVEKLAAAGIPVKAEDVFTLSGEGSVGRLHLARAMLKTRKVKTMDEAFRKYIGFMKPCFVRNDHFTPREAIRLIRKISGVPVIAHPVIMKRDDLIPELVEYGLGGIEAYHTDQTHYVAKHYERLAEEHGLIVTGGSDCHGLGKGKVLMGGVRVPYEVVDRLREESARHG